jgi:hypothetical protein
MTIEHDTCSVRNSSNHAAVMFGPADLCLQRRELRVGCDALTVAASITSEHEQSIFGFRQSCRLLSERFDMMEDIVFLTVRDVRYQVKYSA